MPDINFDQRSLEILNLLENKNEHIFLTGNAGTGKSTLLDHFRKITSKNIAVIAPTGVAAVNVRGETIHSFFTFPPNVTPEHAAHIARRTKKAKLYLALEVLIIDEISMVRADLLDSIDSFLRIVRKTSLPFGGVRLIMVGDLHQLSPVVTSAEQEAIASLYASPYFFSSHVFSKLFDSLYSQFSFIELQTIYRQTDKTFIDILNRLRNKETTEEDLRRLNQRLAEESDFLDDHILLTAINDQADKINQFRLDQIHGPHYSFHATVSGEFNSKQSPATDTVLVKTGARVMLLNNDTNDRWINGTIGTLLKVEPNCVYVKIDGGSTEKIEPVTWTNYQTVFNAENNSLESREVGSFKQIPLRLAWAITIHKSQGKTFEKVAIDLGRGAFAHGQTYVALSRCTSLSGLKLIRPLEASSIIMDKRVLDFLSQLKQTAV
jgi:ATP-dependent DNA helicase PIF1